MPALAGLTRPYSFVDDAREFAPKAALEADDVTGYGTEPASVPR